MRFPAGQTGGCPKKTRVRETTNFTGPGPALHGAGNILVNYCDQSFERSVCSKKEEKMKSMKYGVILLALLLAAMAMVPMVSAEDQTNGVLGVAIPGTSVNSSVHQIPADYLKDSKPAQWLPESDMINIVISQKSLKKFNPDNQSGIINIPVSYLDMKTTFLNSKENPSIYTENTIGQGDSIALVRMPRQMYVMFAKNSNDGIISLPADFFVRYYENVSDLKTHLKVNGTSLQVLPNEKYPVASVLSKKWEQCHNRTSACSKRSRYDCESCNNVSSDVRV